MSDIDSLCLPLITFGILVRASADFLLSNYYFFPLVKLRSRTAQTLSSNSLCVVVVIVVVSSSQLHPQQMPARWRRDAQAEDQVVHAGDVEGQRPGEGLQGSHCTIHGPRRATTSSQLCLSVCMSACMSVCLPFRLHVWLLSSRRVRFATARTPSPAASLIAPAGNWPFLGTRCPATPL